jgi:hypothetical protein
VSASSFSLTKKAKGEIHPQTVFRQIEAFPELTDGRKIFFELITDLVIYIV